MVLLLSQVNQQLSEKGLQTLPQWLKGAEGELACDALLMSHPMMLGITSRYPEVIAVFSALFFQLGGNYYNQLSEVSSFFSFFLFFLTDSLLSSLVSRTS